MNTYFIYREIFFFGSALHGYYWRFGDWHCLSIQHLGPKEGERGRGLEEDKISFPQERHILCERLQARWELTNTHTHTNGKSLQYQIHSFSLNLSEVWVKTFSHSHIKCRNVLCQTNPTSFSVFTEFRYGTIIFFQRLHDILVIIV